VAGASTLDHDFRGILTVRDFDNLEIDNQLCSTQAL
jgi:hypothetical protein